MSEPRRIQLRRTRGWRKPEGAVVVARPTRWGNPWSVSEYGSRHRAVAQFRSAMDARLRGDPDNGDSTDARFPSSYPSLDTIRAELAGRDLACWCPSDEPCHADVLLAVANQR